MYQRSLLRLLLVPSLLSGTVVVFIALTVLGYSGWLYVSNNHIFYNYLFGAYGLQTYVWQHSLGFSTWTQAFLASPLAYYMLVGGVAVIAGLTVFTVLQAAGLVVRGTAQLWQEAHDPGAVHRAVAKELFYRLALRTVSIIGWSVYAVFFVSSLVPFTIILNQFGIERWRHGEWLGAAISGSAWLLLALAFHLHVMFMRLVVLRPRVFGGDEVIEKIEAASDHTELSKKAL